MSAAAAKARVRKAQADVDVARVALRRDWAPWHTRLHEHRVAAIVIGGMASGAALALLPIRWWGGVGALLGKSAALVARSMLAPALAGAAISRLHGTAHQSDTAAPPHA